MATTLADITGFIVNADKDQIDAIIRSATARKKALQQAAVSAMVPGTKVKLQNVSPKYLTSVEGFEVVEVSDSRKGTMIEAGFTILDDDKSASAAMLRSIVFRGARFMRQNDVEGGKQYTVKANAESFAIVD